MIKYVKIPMPSANTATALRLGIPVYVMAGPWWTSSSSSSLWLSAQLLAMKFLIVWTACGKTRARYVFHCAHAIH